MRRHLSAPVRLVAALAACALVAVGCGGNGDGDGGSGDSKELTFGVINGWTDITSTTYLLKDILESEGYTVEVTALNDNAPLWTALSRGNVDIHSSAWPERTHKALMDKYGDELEDINVYFDTATSFLAVPDYMTDINSIEDLPAHAAELDGKVTGLEPGAGLTKMTQEDVFPAYGLDKDFKLVLSSTAAMLTELDRSIKDEKPIVVTLWKPFWANLKFPIKELEDPKKAYGEPEGMHVLGRPGFSEDYPEVANMLKSFEMTEEQFGSLEDLIVNKYGEGEEPKAVDEWLKDNPDFAKDLAAELK